MVEAEFFGRDKPSAQFRDRYGNESLKIQGLTVEQHISRLGEQLLPLADRFARTMREAVALLDGLRALPSPSVERSTAIKISIASLLGATGERSSVAAPVVSASITGCAALE